jgi:hypothetical protein
MPSPHDIAVYYFPGYHFDQRYADWHGAGWTEWELVRRAEARFPGHEQPRIPVWGYESEDDPAAAERKIAAAVEHGVDAFLFDWYWYDGGPFLEGALDRGFLAAGDRRLKFALMWANHDWMNIHPRKRGASPTILERGAVDAAEFVRATDHVIDRYLGDERYWTVGDGLYFSVYDLPTFIRGIGGLEAAAEALTGFRERVRSRLGRELHLNAVLVGNGILTTDRGVADPAAVLVRLGFDSATAYVALHHGDAAGDPGTDFAAFCSEAARNMRRLAETLPVPFFPNVTVGWDASPRTVQSDVFEDLGAYPFSAILTDATPDAFGYQLTQALAWADELAPGGTVVTVNAWNEWTEGSYLEPDERHGFAFLEQIRDRVR